MKELLENWKKYVVTEQEGSGEETFVLKLPKLRISEQWGEPGSDDRKIIEMFTKQIKGSDLGAKITSLNAFVSQCDKACANTKNVAEILANLVFLDSLSSVIYDFNPMTGGFLFESLLSALLGGSAHQVTTSGGREQDVTDIFDDKGRPMSLKFLFDGSGYVKGSFNNLNAAIDNNKSAMYYLVALKNREHKGGDVLSIDFYEFPVGNDNYPGNFSAKEVGEGNGLLVTKIKKPQYHLGNLNFGSRQKIAAVAQNYVDKLGSTLFEIYDQIDALSKNVNEYFLDAPDAKSSALKAKQNAETLKKDTKEL